jgi:hypothetical protein
MNAPSKDGKKNYTSEQFLIREREEKKSFLAV